MSKYLVIVESPAKAKTIGRYLGKEYKITASVGHIRDLPSSTLGVDVKNDFKPRYINMRGKDKVIRELKALAKEVEFIYLATDPDREGEAIAWHLANILKIDPASKCRISFNEITERAVKESISNPRAIDMDLVNSQQARRILDRLVGYELSPLLWKKIRKGLSAGRVQSVATRMLVEKEREINAFIPEEYWNLYAYLNKEADKQVFRVKYHGTLVSGKAKKFEPKSKEDVEKILSEIKKDDYFIFNIKKGERKKRSGPPFTTSTLQQDASRRLGFTSRRTMRVAQQLYEGIQLQGQGQTALVTYIRTDSVRISEDALNESRNLIRSQFGDEYLPTKAKYFKNKNASQDAHEAIRPAHFELSPDKVKDSLSHEQYRLYDMIWKRFLASQMSDAKLNTISVDVENNKHIFRTNGETIIFPGYLRIYDDPEAKDDDKDNARLPELNDGEHLLQNKIEKEQKFTQPPARYTEASLIKALEEEGIGRPSTYAPTISTILDRNYAEKEQKSLKPTDLGTLVTEMLEENFDKIVDTTFTANMENELDKVEEGTQEWIEILKRFYPDFHALVEKADEKVEKIKIPEEKLGLTCPECKKGELLLKQGRYGKFIACNNFPDCKYTESYAEKTGRHCPKCGSDVVQRKSKRGRLFYTCDKKGSDPECDFINWNLPIDGENCPICNSYMVEKRARGQVYKSCSNLECESNKKSKSKAKPSTKKKTEVEEE